MITRIAAIAGSVFADAIRRRIVLLIGFFGFVLAVAIPSLPSYGFGVEGGVFREVALALTYAAAVVLALVLAANRVPGEIERRTLYNVLAKPVHRAEYLAGTWAGVVAVLGVMIAGFTVVEQAIGWFAYDRQFMWILWEGALAIWMECSVLAAFAVAVSAAAGPVVVVIASAALLFIGHARDGVLGSDAPALARALYPSLDTFNIISPVAHGSGVGGAYIAGMLVSFVGWVGVLLLLGAVILRRRDL